MKITIQGSNPTEKTAWIENFFIQSHRNIRVVDIINGQEPYAPKITFPITLSKKISSVGIHNVRLPVASDIDSEDLTQFKLLLSPLKHGHSTQSLKLNYESIWRWLMSR